MGTRSITDIIVVDELENGKERESILLTIYRQMDGYPSGMGLDLANFLLSGKLVNGFNPFTEEKRFNGAGCLAAQLVAHLKTGTGGTYIVKPKTRDMWEEFRYQVYINEVANTIKLRCLKVGNKRYKELFFDNPDKFNDWLEKENED